ncbi:hypothetical protein POV26_11065 [Aequorivita todarodis]|uniref:hypothetical protein n=1 Tax=Aequorivita todarodis TaxID=2036821 RepID=UPI0023506F94|nr:hypothetical protein [Aequorivita todarodis]MDC8001580.1 hypothetical protein [Aequorivita todarodis]
MKFNPTTLRKMGWLCFALMWIPFITLFIGMWGMPDGSYDFDEIPTLTQYSLVALGILFALTFIFFIGSVVSSRSTKNKLLKSGKEAPAEITRVYETGTTVNNSYMVGFELKVMPKHAPHFSTTTEQLISRLDIHEFQVGKKVLVAYDPESHEATIIGRIEGELES